MDAQEMTSADASVRMIESKAGFVVAQLRKVCERYIGMPSNENLVKSVEFEVNKAFDALKEQDLVRKGEVRVKLNPDQSTVEISADLYLTDLVSVEVGFDLSPEEFGGSDQKEPLYTDPERDFFGE